MLQVPILPSPNGQEDKEYKGYCLGGLCYPQHAEDQVPSQQHKVCRPGGPRDT